ncbi:MAG: SHOCT domain-containing protein [Bacteroidota bacterium]
MLTEQGQEQIKEIATRYDLTPEVVTSVLEAVAKGGGTMAQFNMAELGGHAQWMKGGMTMVGDMFNNSLKAKVSNLCQELSTLLSSSNLFVKSAKGDEATAGAGGWWPSDLGQPTASGAQNTMRYAYFAAPVRRLVVEIKGQQSIYDTLSHQIFGVSQQQGTTGNIAFTSQHGPVDLAALPLISGSSESVTPSPTAAPKTKSPQPVNQPEAATEGDIFTALERLATLLEKGILTQEEFNNKKSELLKRI